MMPYKQCVYWLTLLFVVTAAGFASSQTGDGPAADALVIDPRRFERMDDTLFESEGRVLGAVASFEPGVRTMGQTGPRIDMRQPGDKKVFRAGEAVAVDIAFLPADDGAEPDMDTLEVVVRRGFFGKDITETVRAHVQGNAIRVPRVDFSGYTGDFQFVISIKDQQRRGSQLWFSLTIRF